MLRYVVAILCTAAFINAAGGAQCKGEVSMLDVFHKDLKLMQKTPAMYDAEVGKPVGDTSWGFTTMFDGSGLREKALGCEVKAIFYDGMPYKGKPVRHFAYLGVPKVPAGTKVPGIVLVHGGGGSAFEAWVRLWVARGYAAIAMDNCGTVPVGEYGNWNSHEWSGPNCNMVFDTDVALRDSWTYHAVSSVILANSLLRSLPSVDPNRIGVTGISWGGYLTCITAGIDSRFKYAVPVYGCGYLVDNSTWLPEFERLGAERTQKWLAAYDPSVFIGHAKMPVMWVTGTNDFAYPMDSLQKSYRLLNGKETLCVRIEMPHGHGGVGERPDEILAFAEASTGGTPMTKVSPTQCDASTAWASYKSQGALKSAELIYTKDNGLWPERKWHSIPADISETQLRAKLPADAKVFYFNVVDQRNLLVSSEHVEL